MINESVRRKEGTHDFGGRFAGAVTGSHLDANEQGIRLVGRLFHHVVQLRHVLERVQRHDSIVVVGGHQKHRR